MQLQVDPGGDYAPEPKTAAEKRRARLLSMAKYNKYGKGDSLADTIYQYR